MLGICTRYCRHDATQVALLIANWAKRRNIPVSIYSPTRMPRRLGSAWDDEVRRTSELPFTEWVRKCTTVIWTHVPHAGQVDWCNTQSQLTSIFVLWDELKPGDRHALREADCTLSPSSECAKLIHSRWGIRQSLWAPLAIDFPATRKDPRINSNYIWVLLPLFDRAPYKTEATALEVAGRLLAARDDVILTVGYNSSTMASHGKQRLRRFQRYFGSRCRVLRGTPWPKQPYVFAEHDLTLWPAHFDNTCFTPLLSVTAGTPVVSFKVPPAQELLLPETAILVPGAKENGSRFGVPSIEPDYYRFERTVQSLLLNPEHLKAMQQSVLHGLGQRHKVFNEVLGRIIC